jgi:hypothetical protein
VATRARRGAAVGARTEQRSRAFPRAAGLLSLIAVLASPLTTRGEAGAAEALPARPYVEELRARFSYFDQRGRGLQSQAEPTPQGGSERLRVFQPMLLLGLRQNPDVRHTFILPIDVVSSASADALDAVSSASRENEAGSIEARTDWSVTGDHHLAFRGGYHIEEPLKSTTAGVAYTRDLARDNAAVSISGNASFDVFDPYQPDGTDLGFVRRAALNANASVSQILSRTTLASLTYGITHQWGVLAQTWNAIPVDCAGLCPQVAPGEIFPRTRTRHALAGFLAQRVPLTDSTVRVRYRFYSDDIGIVGHTLENELYQYVTRRAYVVLRYRYHRQSQADFWMPSILEADIASNAPRTSDSDLSRFDAHEWGVRAVVQLQAPRVGPNHALDVGYLRYRRSTPLVIDAISVGYSRAF